MQVETTTAPATRHCSRCDNDLPLDDFGSHAYCRTCYRDYMIAWKADHGAKKSARQAAALRALKDGRCVICGGSRHMYGKVCANCNLGMMSLGDVSPDFPDRLQNALDLYNGLFSKSR